MNMNEGLINEYANQQNTDVEHHRLGINWMLGLKEVAC